MKTRKGFSLIELLIVMGIGGVMLGATAPVFVRQIEVRAARKCVEEVQLIQNAALKYYVNNREFPDNVQTLKDAGLLNPTWDGKNPFGNDYELSSAGLQFTVSTQLPPRARAVVTAELPYSVAVPDEAASFMVVSSVMAPGGEWLDKLIHRSDSSGADKTTMIDELFVQEVRSPADTGYQSDFGDGTGEIKDIYVAKAGKWLSEIRPHVTEAEEVVVQTITHRYSVPNPPPRRRTAHSRVSRTVSWISVPRPWGGILTLWFVNGNLVGNNNCNHTETLIATARGTRYSGNAHGEGRTGSHAHGNNGWRGTFRVSGTRPHGTGSYTISSEVWTEWWE